MTQLDKIEIESFPVFNIFSNFYTIFLENQQKLSQNLPRKFIYEEAEKQFIQKYGSRAYGGYESFKNMLNVNVRKKNV
jgi:hypothetical protein